SPHDAVMPAKSESMLEVGIEGPEVVLQRPGWCKLQRIQIERDNRSGAVGLVVVRLQTQVRLVRKHVRPAADDIASAGVPRAPCVHVFVPVVEVTVKTDSVPRRSLGIQAETGP